MSKYSKKRYQKDSLYYDGKTPAEEEVRVHNIVNMVGWDAFCSSKQNKFPNIDKSKIARMKFVLTKYHHRDLRFLSIEFWILLTTIEPVFLALIPDEDTKNYVKSVI